MGGFTQEAKDFAAGKPIELVYGRRFSAAYLSSSDEWEPCGRGGASASLSEVWQRDATADRKEGQVRRADILGV